MAALIGALRVSLSADTAKFAAGMKGAERQARTSSSAIAKSLGGIKAGLAGLAAGLSIGVITNAIHSALEYAGSLAEMAQQLGVTARDLQNFRAVAGQVGVSQEQLEVGLSKLTITLGKIAAGAKEPLKAFEAIGISADQLKGKDTGEVFRMMADGLQKVTDRSQRAVVEVTAMGKSGSKLDNMLSGGSKAINELAAANEALGGVLSDEQIQNADKTADKLRQLHTVLKAQIAGAVADNASAILGLANALVGLVSGIGKALNAWRQMEAEFNAGFSQMFGNAKAAAEWRGKNFQSGKQPTIPGRSVTISLAPPKPLKTPAGPDIEKFLAPSAGKEKKGPKDNTARNTFQFEQDMQRTQIDILQAQQDLATDYVDRTRIGLAILALERQAYEHEIAYQVSTGDLTKTRAQQLLTEDAKLVTLKQDKLLQDEELDRQRDFNEFAAQDADAAKEHLQLQSSLAETASERRAIELKILDLAYREEKERLERLMRESKDWAEIEHARRDLLALNNDQSLKKQNVIAGTRGPMEDWLAGLPTTAAKAQEALQRLEVEGFDGLIDAALELSNGFGSAKDALLNTLKSFLLGLAKMELQKGLGSLLSGIKLPGFATGGFTGSMSHSNIAGFVHGQEGVLNAGAMARLGVPSLNALNSGASLSAVVGNDNVRGGVTQVFNFPNSDYDSFRRSERQVGRAARRRFAIP
jgi:hypothetical protein